MSRSFFYSTNCAITSAILPLASDASWVICRRTLCRLEKPLISKPSGTSLITLSFIVWATSGTALCHCLVTDGYEIVLTGKIETIAEDFGDNPFAD